MEKIAFEKIRISAAKLNFLSMQPVLRNGRGCLNWPFVTGFIRQLMLFLQKAETRMRKSFFALTTALALSAAAGAQCSICTRTAAQLGEKPARGLNAGILYLAITPLALAGGIGYYWWKKEKASV